MDGSLMARVPQAYNSQISAKNHVFKLKVIKQEAMVMPEMVADLIESHNEIEDSVEADDFSLFSSHLK